MPWGSSTISRPTSAGTKCLNHACQLICHMRGLPGLGFPVFNRSFLKLFFSRNYGGIISYEAVRAIALET